MNGNRICSVANLELEGEGKTAKDLEGAGVGGGKGRVRGGHSNENRRGGEEVRREGRGWGVCGRWGKGTRKGRLQISEKMKEIIIRRDRKLHSKKFP